MAVVAVVVVDWQDSNTAWKQKQCSYFSPLLVTTYNNTTMIHYQDMNQETMILQVQTQVAIYRVSRF